MRLFPLRLVAAACLLAPAFPAAAAPVEVRLAAEGKALQKVVVAPGATDGAREAARDLAACLGRIAGATFEVVQGDGSTGLAVGVHTDFPALKTGAAFDSANPLRRDEYLLRTHESGAWLIGASDRAATHAVWDFLHSLGYRLFFLTDTWEVVPSTPDLRAAVDTLRKPSYVTRLAPRGAPWSNRELWKRWQTRNRVASDFDLNTGHAYGGIIRANRDAFKEHPEYFALVDGQRKTPETGGGDIKFCVSNPGLRKLVADHAVRAFQAEPGRDSISMDPSDGSGWCECEACARMGSVSDRVVTLAGDVAEAINGLGLGPKYVGIYAYNQHSPPPNIKVHPKVVVSLATSFIRGGFTIQTMVEGWSAQGATLGVREYHSVFPWAHDMPRRERGGNLAYLQRTIPYFHKNGARFMNSENGDSWGADGLGFWLSPILLWDVSAAERVDAYVDDFLDKAFGPAKEPMRDFYKLVNMDRSPRTPEDVVGRMYRSLAEARKLAAAPAVHARLDDLVLYTRYAELYNQYRAASRAPRQSAFEALWRHVYRMRDRMLLSTVAICHRDVFRDRSVKLPEGVKWETPEPKHPWKSSQPFAPEELAAVVSKGIENNPIATLDFEPVEYSDDLVPAAPLNLTSKTEGSLSLRGRGTRRFQIWLDKPGAIELGVTGGLIAHYRDRGNVKVRLFSPKEATLEPVATDESVPPDGKRRAVTLRSPYDGLHTLEVSDGGDMTLLETPPGLPLTILSSMENRASATLPGRWTLCFYVPQGAKVVGGFAPDLSGQILDGGGAKVYSFKDLKRPGYFNVPVPKGQDGRLWWIEGSSGEKLLMTVPPCLARNAAELLLPREVVEGAKAKR